MIKTLRLQNFQSHTDTLLEFDPHFNCIVGAGNHGKSSIIRALSVLFYNTWDTSWVTWGTPFCTITATLVDGSTLVRKKGPKVNEYIFTEASGKAHKYENFGTSVPQEIQDFLKIYIVELPGGEKLKLNFHSQFDSLLQSLSPANKAKLFGQLSGLQILDTVSQELSAEKRQLQTTVKVKEEEHVQLLVQIQSLSHLGEQRCQLDQFKSSLNLVVNQVDRLQQLKQLQQKVDSWKMKNSRITEQLQQYQPIADFDTDILKAKIKTLRSYADLQKRIAVFKQKHTLLQSRLQLVGTALTSAKQQYVDSLKQANLCPTCRTPVTASCIDQILQEL